MELLDQLIKAILPTRKLLADGSLREAEDSRVSSNLMVVRLELDCP